MLHHLNKEDVLFLDIETVSQQQHFSELEAEDQFLWQEKSRFIRERKELSLEESYSEAGIHAEFGKIICISVGYFIDEDERRTFRTISFYGVNEEEILRDFSRLLRKYYNKPFRMLCAHNGKEFDFPYLCRRMLINRIPLPAMLEIAGRKPWEIVHLDTMELWKFGDYKHYTSIRLLARVFGIPTPKDDIDGSMVNDVYYNEKNLSRIEVYCRKDVVTVAQVFLAYRGETLLRLEEIHNVVYERV